LDVIPNKDGFNHIALFSPAESSTPQWLTTGAWEVTSEVLGVDMERGLVYVFTNYRAFAHHLYSYFVAAAPSSIERHVYSAKLPDPNTPVATPSPPTALTNDQQVSWYSASFSPQSGFYSLSYSGPNVPWQKVLQIGKKGLSS
jgi:dipeptidyl aminopeptidase